ncbi:MAG: GTPase [Planctomycetota bacterium]
MTPAGAGAIAVIRVTGPGALGAVGELFRAPDGSRVALDPGSPRRLRYGQITVDGQPLDDVIVSAQVTSDGTPSVDMSTHGGTRIVERVLMAIQAQGFEIEVTGCGQRAAWPVCRPIEAEIIAALTRAQTRRAVGFLLRQRQVLAEHLDALARTALHEPAAARDGLRRLRDSARAGRFLVEGATVALIGPPNAGKSTLANRLFGAPRAIVSQTPGTTRDWVAEPTAIRGIPVSVVDTPGIADTPDALDALAIRRAVVRWTEADLQVIVVDGGSEVPDQFFDRVHGRLRTEGLVVVVNKSDLPRVWDDTDLPGGWRHLAIAVSALRGDGLGALEERIVAALGLADRRDEEPSLFTDRQREAASAILDAAELPAEVLSRRIGEELGLAEAAAPAAGV